METVSAATTTVFPPELREFVDRETWTYAKTVPEWPHEYLVRERVGDEDLFIKLIMHFRAEGYERTFYRMKITYYDEDGLTYWTMGAPAEETIIINRCKKENTYEVRQANSTLPDQ